MRRMSGRIDHRVGSLLGVALILGVSGCDLDAPPEAEDQVAAVAPVAPTEGTSGEFAGTEADGVTAAADPEVPPMDDMAEEQGALGGLASSGGGSAPGGRARAAHRRARRPASVRPRLGVRANGPAALAPQAAPARRAAPRGVEAPQAPLPQALPQNAVLSSTFVGGSGAQARLDDLLDRGVVVDGRNIRLEAFDELGRLPYPVPAREAVGLHAQLERTRLHTGGGRVHLQIALMARQGEAPVRPRMDIRLVLDRSGSMIGEKWTQAIAAAHQLVDRLEPGDTFGLVSYSDDATVDLQPARVGNRRAAHAAINHLQPGGGTNIEAALRAVERISPRRRAMNDVLLSVLVSDGVATVGQTNASELGRIARQLFDASGVLTTSVGLGTDFDEETMLSIAREGSGSYHFVRRAGDISDILTDELEERALAVAQALRVRVELGEGVVARRVYGSQVLEEQQAQAVRRTEVATDRRLARELGIARDRQQDEDRGLRIHLPTFRRGDQHVILMELEVPPGTQASRIARVTLDYKDLLTQRNRTAHADVRAERTADREASIASTERTVKRTVLAFAAGDALESASAALARGDVAGARSLLAERRRVLVAGARLWNDPALQHDADLLGRYETVIGGAWNGWDGSSRRTMMMAMNFYGNGRMR